MSGVGPIAGGIDAAAAVSPSNYVTAESLREGDPAECEAVHLTKGWRGEYRMTEPLVKQFDNYVP